MPNFSPPDAAGADANLILVNPDDCLDPGLAARLPGIPMLLIGIVVGLIIGVVLGFLLGTRAKQTLAALKAVGSVFKRLPFTFKEVSDQNDGENDVEDEEEKEDKGIDADMLDEFLNTEQGLDLHPELEINPIMLYHLKVQKERSREQARLDQLEGMRQELIAQGLSEVEANERVEIEMDMGIDDDVA